MTLSGWGGQTFDEEQSNPMQMATNHTIHLLWCCIRLEYRGFFFKSLTL